MTEIAERLGATVPSLRGARIFLTGGTGFFGKWLVESFSHFNRAFGLQAELYVLCRDPSATTAFWEHARQNALDLDPQAVKVVQGNVVDFAFPEGRFSHVIHAAAPTNMAYCREHPVDAFNVMVHGSGRVLDFSRRCGAQRFLFVSSGAVYGKQVSEETVKLGENSSALLQHREIADVYGFSKQTVERLCLLYRQQYKLDTVSARCFAFAGPYLPMTGHYAVGNFIRDAIQGGPIVIKGDGTAERSYMYMGDLMVWLWTLLSRPQCSEVYNVGSDSAVSIRGLAEAIAAQTGAKVRVEQEPRSKAKESYVPDISKARAELGLDAWTPLESAVEKTLRWARAATRH